MSAPAGGVPVPSAAPAGRAQQRAWVHLGNELFAGALARLDDAALAAPSPLPGWSRKHVAAHICGAAGAVRNLITWAATGVETPMYTSIQARNEGIERGVAMSRAELIEWAHSSAQALETGWDELTEAQWDFPVRHTLGREMPASDTVWMRARELCVHTVDLDAGVSFDDLPDEFNTALCQEICAMRKLSELPAQVAGAPVAQVAAWLSGRAHELPDAPELGPWI